MRYWNGLGQAAAQLTTPPTDAGYIPTRVVDGELRVYPYGFAILYDDGSAYYQDSTKYWETWGPDGFKCWGDGISGGWKCDDGSSGGSWYTSPAATIKKKAAATAAAPPPAANTTTTTTPAPTPAPSTPPPAKDPNDQIVSQQGPDAAGGIVYYYASNASYYVLPDGTWTYTDADGNSYSGDARGNYCDSLGNCTGPDWGPSTDNTWIYIAGGALVVLLIVMGGRRR
jgi:hypothetical protein